MNDTDSISSSRIKSSFIIWFWLGEVNGFIFQNEDKASVTIKKSGRRVTVQIASHGFRHTISQQFCFLHPLQPDVLILLHSEDRIRRSTKIKSAKYRPNLRWWWICIFREAIEYFWFCKFNSLLNMKRRWRSRGRTLWNRERRGSALGKRRESRLRNRSLWTTNIFWFWLISLHTVTLWDTNQNQHEITSSPVLDDSESLPPEVTECTAVETPRRMRRLDLHLKKCEDTNRQFTLNYSSVYLVDFLLLCDPRQNAPLNLLCRESVGSGSFYSPTQISDSRQNNTSGVNNLSSGGFAPDAIIRANLALHLEWLIHLKFKKQTRGETGVYLVYYSD
jgi:hypothetical protein